MDITVSGIYKSYDGKAVLTDFGAVFPEGAVTCVMGPSGCGKTTLLNILMGLVKAEGGVISGVPERIAAVFQEDRLCENFSAVENLRIAVGRKLSRERAAAELRELKLGKADIYIPARELSGGMKRRVAIARAMTAESEALFLDEPFRGLDKDTKSAAIDYVLRRRGGRTMVMVTHDMEEAEAVKGSVIRMR